MRKKKKGGDKEEVVVGLTRTSMQAAGKKGSNERLESLQGKWIT